MSYASTTGWQAGAVRQRPVPRRWEIAGLILGFIFVWPLALTYLIWKWMGYPMLNEMRAFLDRTIGGSAPMTVRSAPFMRSTGNSAFEDYRRSEIARLEEERRRLDEESRAFAGFVEELKRAKDREEFDLFMKRRRGGDAGSTAV